MISVFSSRRCAGVWCFLLAAVLVGLPLSPAAALAKPLGEEELATLVKVGIGDDAIVAKIEKDGVGFASDDNALARLKAAGASEAVLSAVKKAGKPSAPTAATPPVTYEQVIELLRIGIGEDAILKRLEASPTVFTLDVRQVEDLKRAGAGDKLLAAMQKGRPASAAAAEMLTDFAIVLDCSGSMKEKTKEGETKMAAAKRVVGDLVQKIPDGLNLTFVIYGHEVYGDAADPRNCQAVKVARPLGPIDAAGKAELGKLIDSLQPAGATPIALALETAGKELARNSGGCGLTLITDGKETCKGDPVAAAAGLAKNGKLTFGVNVVGFDVDADERKSLEEIAAAGKGKYYNAESSAELGTSVAAISAELKKTAEPGERAVLVRAVKVLAPRKIKLPALKAIAVVEAGDFGPDVRSNYDPVADGKAYDEVIRLPSAKNYDVLWIPAAGKHVRMVKDLSIKERKTVDVKPEDHLGLVRVHGEGLPKPKTVALTKAGDFGPDTPSNFSPVQLCSAYGQEMVVPAGEYDVWLKPADGGKAEKLEEKLTVKAGELTEVGAASGGVEGDAAARRAIIVAQPKIKLPALKLLAVVTTGDFGPTVPSNYSPVVEVKNYGEEIRLPSDKEYDLLWIPVEGRYVRMVAKLSIKDRKVVTVKPEDHLGLVRVGGQGLPKPKIIALTKVGGFGPDTPSNFSPVQSATQYGTDMVVPAGKYDLWLQSADQKTQKLEEELEVKPGEVTVVD